MGLFSSSSGCDGHHFEPVENNADDFVHYNTTIRISRSEIICSDDGSVRQFDGATYIREPEEKIYPVQVVEVKRKQMCVHEGCTEHQDTWERMGYLPLDTNAENVISTMDIEEVAEQIDND